MCLPCFAISCNWILFGDILAIIYIVYLISYTLDFRVSAIIMCFVFQYTLRLLGTNFNTILCL